MLPVSKYVNTNVPEMKDKDDFKIWEMLSLDAREIVVAEYMGDCLKDGLRQLGETLVAGMASKPLDKLKPPVSVPAAGGGDTSGRTTK